VFFVPLRFNKFGKMKVSYSPVDRCQREQ